MSDNAKQQAIAQANSIIAMVAALEVDYDRLEELRELEEESPCNDENMDADDLVELAELEEAAGDCKDEDEAQERIQEDALAVCVRSDWHQPGNEQESKPSEFYILLCTGGPAVRIIGRLDEYQQPCRAWLEYQDWGTGWMQLRGEIEKSTLLAYCQQFYFGE